MELLEDHKGRRDILKRKRNLENESKRKHK